MEIVYVEEGQYLAHHGILGQKWGVRRFQNKDGSLTVAGKQRYGVTKTGDANAQKSESKSDYDHSTGKSELGKAVAYSILGGAGVGAYFGFRFGGIGGAKIGAAVGATAGTILAGSLVVEEILARHGEKKISESNKESGEVDPKTGFYKKANREYTQKEDIDAVNPGYARCTQDTSNNCVLCSLTYNLRQSGYAVTANYASSGYSTDDLKRWFKNPKITKHDEALESFNPLNPRDKNFVSKQKEIISKTQKEIESEGPGARGYFAVGYYVTDGYGYVASYGGHAMAYEVNQSGKVDIIDAQSGKVYKDAFNDKSFRLLNQSISMDHARLDNCKVIPDHIQEVAHS